MTATATQLALFSERETAPKPVRAQVRYVVEVNECAIFATQRGADWWIDNILRRPIARRIHWLSHGLAGGIAQIPCDSQDDAGFMCAYMIEHGICDKHVKVKRIKEDREPPCPA